jgi:hypothetical protein
MGEFNVQVKVQQLFTQEFAQDNVRQALEAHADNGKYSINQATKNINQWLMDIGAIKVPIPAAMD